MNLYRIFQDRLAKIAVNLAAAGSLPQGLDTARITVEPTRDTTHGDIATNAAMVLAGQANQKPRDVAALFVTSLAALDGVERVDVAGPGFINLRLDARFWQAHLREILQAGRAYGDSTMGGGKAINIEYVSANPTGPMHVGHGRGAVVGDALAGLLEKAGFAVTREYYINDAGTQVDVLARSLHLRYREALGEDIGPIPEGLYPGDYLIPVARALADRDGPQWRDMGEQGWLPNFRDHAIAAMMSLIRKDLAALGVEHAVFTSESALVKTKSVDNILQVLTDKSLIYKGTLEPPKGKIPEDWEPRPQTLFRATQFGDDVDRPLVKSDGSWTYFATDVAYHHDKFQRGFKSMINVWGADHGGYVKRMQAAVQALTDGEGALDVKLCQMVNLLDGGAPVKMSKRAGTFVTLRDVIEEVGKDVVRFIMLTRKSDAQLDFDLAKVLEQSRDNPVFYVQYAHARICSVFRNALDQFTEAELQRQALAEADLSRIDSPSELNLIKAMANWPRLVEAAAEAHEPHRVAFYLHDLASAFHGLWNKGNNDAALRFLKTGDKDTTRARLALLRAVASVIASGLEIFRVTPVEEMRG
jgi:arginyl-tRNA synthetase